jgi:hypothetical protein
MQNVQPEIRIHVFHTGRVCVSPGLPVSAYLIEHPQGKILVDTGWHREILSFAAMDS